MEELDGRCAIYRARSRNGRDFRIDAQPMFAPIGEGPFAPYERGGVRDARVTRFDGAYYITYLASSHYGYRLGLATTEDFTSVRRIALISEPDTKNGVLFPRKINGKYALLQRPQEGGSIWISYSEDLVYWGEQEVVMTPRGGYWDYHRIGASTVPIETDSGWLVIYYGIKVMPGGPLFRLGAAFLGMENPAEVRGRSNVPILAPLERYERVGDVSNLVFSCGALLSDDRTELEIYYGASDSCIALGTVRMKALERICNLGGS